MVIYTVAHHYTSQVVVMPTIAGMVVSMFVIAAYLPSLSLAVSDLLVPTEHIA